MTKKRSDSIDGSQEVAPEENMDGLPSPETEAALAQDEVDRPLGGTDFFDFCSASYDRNGVPIVFTIKRNGKYQTTLSPPCDWEKIRELYGAGHYTVICKNQLTGRYLKQITEMVDASLTPPAAPSEETPFQFGQQPNQGSDMSPILVMMQNQNEARAIADRDQRIRDEAQRREDRERDEMRRKEERENRNDLFKMVLTAVPSIIPLIMPKKDDKLDTLLEFMKDSQRNQQTQAEKFQERLERLADPKKDAMDPLALVKMLNESKKDGRKEMEELLDMVEERAERRAAELGSGEKEESTLSLLIKNLGPGLAALMAQGGQMPQIPAAEAAPAETSVPAETVPVPAAPKQKTKNEIDQEKIFKIILPFFGEQFMRMQNNQNVNAKSAAKESLGLLKSKGFPQARVVELFSRDALFGVLRAYKVPKEYDSWFNEYYEALTVPETAPAPRSRPAKPRSTSGDNVPLTEQSSGNSGGFVPAKASVGPGPAVVESGAPVGASPESIQ